MNYWKYYKSARLRELYKNHYLKHYGLTPLEVQCIMRKFKIIVDTADKDYKAVSTCKCTARKVKEYFRKNTQKGYENLIFLLGDGLFFQQLC